MSFSLSDSQKSFSSLQQEMFEGDLENITVRGITTRKTKGLVSLGSIMKCWENKEIVQPIYFVAVTLRSEFHVDLDTWFANCQSWVIKTCQFLSIKKKAMPCKPEIWG